MPKKNALDICRVDLFTKEDELAAKYDADTVAHVLRLRDMYLWAVANPSEPDKIFIREILARYDIKQAAAYADLAIIKKLLPLITQTAKDYKRWKSSEMLLETYNMAKRRKDTRTMEKAASSYAKINRVDIEDERTLPFDLIVVQPFTATSDPRVLNIEPIPNLREKVTALLQKYRAQSIDIEDVQCEEADLEEEEIWGADNINDTKDEQEDIL